MPPWLYSVPKARLRTFVQSGKLHAESTKDENSHDGSNRNDDRAKWQCDQLRFKGPLVDKDSGVHALPMHPAHKRVQRHLLEIWEKMKRHAPRDLMEETLILQCEVAWSVVDSIKLLCNRHQGVAAMVLCRGMFERTAAIDFLANSSDPQILTDYIDYGKVIAYELADGLNAPQQILNPMKAEYETIKARLGNRKWHRTTIERLVAASFDTALGPGEKSLYKTFYKEASSFAHGDSFAVLRHRPRRGWHQVFDPDEQSDWAIEALSLTYQFFASMLFQVQIRCHMDLQDDFTAAIPALEELPRSA